MIKVIGQSNKSMEYSIAYYQSARTLNIDSPSMNDYCKAYRESTGCMTWLDDDNTLCEIECIFPVITENLSNCMDVDTEVLAGIPKLKVSFEEKAIEIAFVDSQLSVIFNKDKKAETKYISSHIDFYVCEDELVAIVCSDYKLLP